MGRQALTFKESKSVKILFPQGIPRESPGNPQYS